MSGWLIASKINEHEKIVPKKGVIKTGVMPNFKDAWISLPDFSCVKDYLAKKYHITIGEMMKLTIVLRFLEDRGIDLREVSGSLRYLTHQFQIDRIKEGRPVWFIVKNEKRLFGGDNCHWVGRNSYGLKNGESYITISEEIS